MLDQALLADPAADPVVARVPAGHRPTSCRVRVRPAPGATPTAARPVPLAAGKVTRVRPADWRPGQVGSAPLQVEVRDTVDGPPVTCFQV